MKGIILAGGKGTRLYPITKVVDKLLLPVYNQPLIFYPLATLREAGVRDILIISSPGRLPLFERLFKKGRNFGVRIAYAIQRKPLGMAHALSFGRDFVRGDKVAVIAGDNIFGASVKKGIADFERQEKGAKIFIREDPEAKRYGVVEFDKERVLNIIEKPERPKTNWAQLGLYLYDDRVFDFIKKLKPSKRGEYEITDLNGLYVSEGTMTFQRQKGWWIDAGTFDALLKANNYMAGKFKKSL